MSKRGKCLSFERVQSSKKYLNKFSILDEENMHCGCDKILGEDTACFVRILKCTNHKILYQTYGEGIFSNIMLFLEQKTYFYFVCTCMRK